MEYTECIVCGNTDSETLFEKKDRLMISRDRFKVVRCKNCGLIYINPRPPKAEIHKFYPRYCFWKEEENILNTRVRFIKSLERSYRFHLLCYETARILKFINLKKGKILDLGCGTGDRLWIFKKMGLKTYGIEPSFLADYGKKKFKLDIFRGDLQDIGFPPEFFDLVTLYNVLEHIHNPRETLKKVKRILKNSGFLVIQIPSTDSLQYKLFRKRWAAFDVPRDLYFFNLKTISSLLRDTGFKPVKVDCSHNWLHPPTIVLTIFPALDPRKVWKDELKSINTLKRFLWVFLTLSSIPFCIFEYLIKKDPLLTIYAKKY